MSEGKGTDPDRLQREIEATRAELAETLDQIADRVSPKRAAGRGVDRLKALPPQQLALLASPVVLLVGLKVWRRSRRRHAAVTPGRRRR